MSPKLPVLTPKKVVRALKRAGFVEDHQSGSHLYLHHPDASTRFVPVPMHAKDLKKRTLKNILRMAGMSVEDLNKYL